MIKDETEDEEPQINFEVNGHLSRFLDVNESMRYRDEIKNMFLENGNISKQ